MNSAGRRVIDAHLHVWNRARSRYSWLGPAHGPLDADIPPAHALSQLADAGVGHAVLVQADDTEEETGYLIEVARDHPWVLGVVGWVDLEEPRAAEARIEVLRASPTFCGVRQLTHGDPRPGVLDLPAVRATAKVLARHDVPLDVPDAWPRDLPATVRLARDQPDLVVVLDHLGKPPPADSEDFSDWAGMLRTLARAPRTVAKLSGLSRAGSPNSAADWWPAVEVALEAFGAQRLMYGGDWPMTLPLGGYQQAMAPVEEILEVLSPSEQAAIWHGTATQVYRLAAPSWPLGAPGHATKS